MPRKSIDTPLQEITLRRYEPPYGLSKRDVVTKLCLSLGLLQPGDSRDSIIDILYVLLEVSTQKKELSSIEIRNKVVDLRKELNLPMVGTADSNIRRQLKRLREVYLVEKIKNNYRISDFSTTTRCFDEKIQAVLLPLLLGRIKEYCQQTDKQFELK